MDTTQPMNLAVGGDTYASHSLYNGGFKVGQFMNDHSESIATVLKVLLIIAIVWLIVSLIQNTNADMDVAIVDASLMGATTAYMNIMYHQRCKSRGGCSRSCPFISEDDPRVVIHKQLENTSFLYEQAQSGVKDDVVIAATASNQITDATKQITFNTTLNGILSIEAGSSQAIGVILNQLKDLDKSFGEVDIIDVALIDAKNKATALGSAAVIQKNILVVASLHLNAQLMIQYIMDVPAEKQPKIAGYDQLVTSSNIAANTGISSIKNIYSTFNTVTADYATAYTAVDPNATTSSQDIIKYMATLISLAHSGEDTVHQVIANLAIVSDANQACRSTIERFSNDLPGTMDNDKMTTLIQANDYESAIIQTALEPGLVAAHQKFAKERSSFESGGGIQSVRDDDNDINPWVGIFGRPTYRKTTGASVDISTGADNYANDLKSIPSDQPTDLMRTSDLRLSTVVYPTK